MSRASRSVNAAYIRSALEVKTQRDELLAMVHELVDVAQPDGWCEVSGVLKKARAVIKKAKKWK